MRHATSRSLNLLQQLFIGGDTQSNDVPLVDLRHARKHGTTHQSPIDKETERHLCVAPFFKSHLRLLFILRELLAAINNEGAADEGVTDAMKRLRAAAQL